MNATEVINQILTKKTIYYIAKVMRLEHVQVKRMWKTGRCQPSQLRQLERISDDVSRETVQNVSNETSLSHHVTFTNSA